MENKNKFKFYYALKIRGLKKFIENFNNSPEVQDCIKIIEQFQRGYTTGTTGDAIKNKSDKVVVEVNQIHKLTMTKLEIIFKQTKNLNIYFIILCKNVLEISWIW